MLEPPDDVTDAEVLAAVRRHWAPEVDAVEHLAVATAGRIRRLLASRRPAVIA